MSKWRCADLGLFDGVLMQDPPRQILDLFLRPENGLVATLEANGRGIESIVYKRHSSLLYGLDHAKKKNFFSLFFFFFGHAVT